MGRAEESKRKGSGRLEVDILELDLDLTSAFYIECQQPGAAGRSLSRTLASWELPNQFQTPPMDWYFGTRCHVAFGQVGILLPHVSNRSMS